MQKLYLHIGTHKTGSTSIQRLLWENRDKLAAQGILYPDLRMGGFGHHDLALATGQGPRSPRNAERIHYWIEQVAALARGEMPGEAGSGTGSRSVHTVVLSSEEFESVQEIGEIRRLADYFDVSVVVYLRKQDHYLESAYNQNVRMYEQRFPGSIYQFAFSFNPFARFNYRSLLERWADCFGPERLVVRPYGTSAVGADVRMDFLRIVGADTAGLYFPGRESERDNVSLQAEAMPYLARINEVSLPAPVHRQVMQTLQVVVPGSSNGRLLRHDESERFYRSFADSNAEVFQRYLGAAEDPFGELVRDEGEETYVDHDAIDVDLLFRVLRQYQAAPSLFELLRVGRP